MGAGLLPSSPDFLTEITTIATEPSLYIADRPALNRFLERLRPLLIADARLALDTEFIRERTYTPVLEVIQLAADAGRFVALIDVPALGLPDLGPLKEVLLDPAILKIVHAGGQDMEILAQRLGQLPANVYDTQIAAAFAGYNLQTGYGPLVQAVLNVRLSKEEGFSDWSRRPLTPAMRDYAENDVRYLHTLHDTLSRLLEKRGRAVWAVDQMNRQLAQAAEVTPPERLFERVGGRSTLESRGLAILRELAIWRDNEAKRRDKPRRSVLKDDVLVEIARRAPKTGADVLALRSAPQNLGEKTADALAACVVRGLSVPEADRPKPEAMVTLDDTGASLVELLTAVVKIKAIEESLPAGLLAGNEELRFLVANRRDVAKALETLFPDWRGTILKEELRATMEGKRAVRWDNKKGRLTLFSPDETA